ncbi:MAG: aspartyl protease family protein [Cyclobacteriaceae bacterium]
MINTKPKRRVLKMLIGVFLCAIFSSSKAQTGFQIYNSQPSTQVRFMERNNLVIIPLTINNKVTLRFVLDTGVRGIILTEKVFADRIGLKLERNVTTPAPGREDSISAYVVNDIEIMLPAIPKDIITTTGNDFSLALGETYDLTNVQIANPGVIAKHQSMTVLKEDYLKLTESLGVEVYGIIGYPLFRQFVIEIDRNEKVLTFYEPDGYKAPNFMEKLPLEIVNSKPYIDSKVTISDDKQIDTKLLVDLGASHAVLLNRSTSEEINLPAKTLYGILGHGLGGEIQGYVGRLQKFSIHDFEFEEVIGSYPDSAYYQGSIEFDKRNGTIGGEILTRFNTTFDYLNGSFYLTKSVNYKRRFDHNMTGIEFRLAGQELDKMLVTNVRLGSPAADAGVIFGDLITKVNRFKVGSDTFGFINDLFRSKEGKKISLKVTRGAEELDLEFRLQKQI